MLNQNKQKKKVLRSKFGFIQIASIIRYTKYIETKHYS